MPLEPQEEFYKKAVLKNFRIFIGKNLSWSLFFIKLFQHTCFPVNIEDFLRTTILKNICERLLLKLVKLDEMV